MKPPVGMDSEQWLRTCVETIASSNISVVNRNLLMETLGIFSGLVYEAELIRQSLPEGIMRESSIVQHYMDEAKAQGIEQGIEQGEKKATIESILAFLSTQFQSEIVQSLRPQLEAIEDLNLLKELLLTAYKTKNLGDFTQTLSE